MRKIITRFVSKITGRNRRRFELERERYKSWIKNNEPSKEELEKQRIFKFEYEPKISIIVPMYNTPISFFEELIECMMAQTYGNWELCLADGSPQKSNKIEEICRKDERIKYNFLNSNLGISGNTNEALKLATGDYIALLDHDDLLPEFCLYEIVKCINSHRDAEFIYTDEDKIIETKENRCDPHFKPDFSPDTLNSNNYITHLSIFKRELMNKLGGFKDEYNGAQDYDIIFRATENAKEIVHIPKILYHWRIHSNSTAMKAAAKPYAYEAGIKAIQDHLNRLDLKAKVSQSKELIGTYKVQYEVIGNPKVSIIIPNKDGINILKKCINSILNKSTYSNYEILIVENNSQEEKTFAYYEKLKSNSKIKILYYPEKGFNYSKIVNFGVKNSDAEFILQLNNDTEVITPDWLEQFIGFAQRKEIGAVGAKLYYADKSIQHAGMAIGIAGIVANLYTRLPYGDHAYFGREDVIANVTGVTGACLFSRREIYEEVGYMEEDKFKVAFNDADFCLKIRDKGYLIVYNPYIELMHYESKTRGYEDTPEKKQRFERECENFKSTWQKNLDKGDPYYSVNFSLDTNQCNINSNKIKYKE